MTRFGKTKHTSWYIERVLFFRFFQASKDEPEASVGARDTRRNASRSPSLAKKKAKK